MVPENICKAHFYLSSYFLAYFFCGKIFLDAFANSTAAASQLSFCSPELSLQRRSQSRSNE
jgi:hypothetical protein